MTHKLSTKAVYNIYKLHKTDMYETICFCGTDDRTHVYEEDNILRYKYADKSKDSVFCRSPK